MFVGSCSKPTAQFLILKHLYLCFDLLNKLYSRVQGKDIITTRHFLPISSVEHMDFVRRVSETETGLLVAQLLSDSVMFKSYIEVTGVVLA